MNLFPLQAGMKTLAVLCLVTLAPAATAETLAETLTDTYDQSGLIEQNRALLRAADEDVAQAVAATLPIINWSISTSASRPQNFGSDLLTSNASISGSLVLYDSGQNQLSIDSQKELVLATRQTLRDIEQQVLLRAVQAYMNVRRDGEFVELRQNNVRVIAQELRAAEDRFEVGEVTRSDVASARSSLAEARSLLAAAEGDLTQSIEEFTAAVGRRPGSLDAVSPAPVSRTVEEAKAFAVRNHPDILEAQHNVAAAELNILRAEAAINPRVDLNAQADVDDSIDFSQSVGVTLSGPIYQGGLLSSQVRRFMATRDSVRSGLIFISRTVQQDVGNSYSFLEVARASLIATREQIAAATVAFDGVREEATLGARTTVDVLNAEQELLDARANLISAETDEVIASYTMLSAMGLLTAEHLKLPVQQYDPAAYYNLVKDAPTSTSDQGAALDRVLRAIGN